MSRKGPQRRQDRHCKSGAQERVLAPAPCLRELSPLPRGRRERASLDRRCPQASASRAAPAGRASRAAGRPGGQAVRRPGGQAASGGPGGWEGETEDGPGSRTGVCAVGTHALPDAFDQASHLTVPCAQCNVLHQRAHKHLQSYKRVLGCLHKTCLRLPTSQQDGSLAQLRLRTGGGSLPTRAE